MPVYPNDRPDIDTGKRAGVDTVDPKLFINRELSWLAFNDRVLAEARDAGLPLYERLKFLGIVSSNLDEFFMVRVAGLKQQIIGGVADTPADGMLPQEQLAAIRERARGQVAEEYRIWQEDMTPQLAARGVVIISRDGLSAEQLRAVKDHFSSSVFPALTPLAVDQGHPFPHLRNKSLNIAVLLRRDGRRRRREPRQDALAVVQVPSVLKRLVPVPVSTGQTYMLLEDLISIQAADLFPGFTVVETASFRVTRNWDLNVDEEESEDLLSTIKEELRRRDRGAAVRLELDAKASAPLEQQLTSALMLTPEDVYRVRGPLQMSDLPALADTDPRPELRVDHLVPAIPSVLRDADSMFSLIKGRDQMLHHPYESFDPVIRFVEEAAEDPDVLAIQQTLYRTSGDSPIARALSKAVVYGLVGLKTHCKIALVVRREGSGIRRYVHLGTGNYNPQTARQYTDVSLFTAREEIADDATALFNMLTGYSIAPNWRRFAVAPFNLKERILALIQRETELARKGEPAQIVAKMNALVDPVVIRALYAASQAGVDIHLLVRGICCLRPGVPGVSERIRVTSVVDRFLEHSRVFAFGVGSRIEVYLSSADWMPRNFHRRVEVMFPVEDEAIRTRLLDEVLGAYAQDNVKARRLLVDGRYAALETNTPAFRSQLILLEAAKQSGGVKIHELIRHVAAPERPAEAIRAPLAAAMVRPAAAS